MSISAGRGRRNKMISLLRKVLIVVSLLYFVSNFGVDGRHISLKKHQNPNQRNGERITEDSLTIEGNKISLSLFMEV
jgi:hypothetical protein